MDMPRALVSQLSGAQLQRAGSREMGVCFFVLGVDTCNPEDYVAMR